MLDLLVIGAGFSGLTAAIYAAQAGLRVKVITKGLSALHWGAGSIDLLGYLPDNTPVNEPIAAIAQLPANHPLRQVKSDFIRTTLSDLQKWLQEAGLPYQSGDHESNLWLPSAVGAKRPTYLAPLAQAAAQLDNPAPLLVVGFDRLRDFYPALLADNLTQQGHAARAYTLPFSLLTDRHDANTIHLAQELENPARLDALIKALRAILLPGERVALPAILGIDQHAQIIAKMQDALGTSVAEIPTLPPSVPGLRLHHALVHKLEKLGVRVESNMEAIEFGTALDTNTATPNIQWVATATSARALRHRAAAYLLATGGFLGGGFNSNHNGHAWETVFNLPLSLPANRGQWFRPEFLDRTGHPIFHSGVQVNESWQPVDNTGAICYGNLWAAGNLLAHADTIRTRSHEGLALVTGAAALHAMRRGQAVMMINDGNYFSPNA